MRVTQVINNLQVGGAETMMLRLAKHLDHSRHEIRVISLMGNGPIGDELRDIGVQVECIGARGSFSALSLIRRLRRALVNSAPHVIQSWMYHSNLISTLCRDRSISAPICWNVRHSLHAFKNEKFMTRMVIHAGSKLSKRPEAIIFNSRTACEQHKKIGYRNGRMIVIPNGVDMAEFTPVPEARQNIQARLGLKNGSFLIGCVGRRHPDKNQQLLLDAMKCLVQQRRNVHCLFIGRGFEPAGPAEKWTRVAGLEQRVHLMGEQRPIAPLLSGLDCLVLPSRGESFPNVLIEAMACAVPCVTTDVGDAAEIVGNPDHVVQAGDVDGLTSALIELIDKPDLRHEFSKNARSRVADLYSIHAVVRQYEDLWHDLAGSHEA
ncbi:MAG: glycosyltransferase [Phycisphaerales bacterium]|nr:glycosyltransferase [Phycisphaerales bacterium]